MRWHPVRRFGVLALAMVGAKAALMGAAVFVCAGLWASAVDVLRGITPAGSVVASATLATVHPQETGRLELTNDLHEKLGLDFFSNRGDARGASSSARSYSAPRSGLLKAPEWNGSGGWWNPSRNRDDDGDEKPGWNGRGEKAYRTVCVRMCDGYNWPVSFSATRSRFTHDAKVCENSCNSPAKLFYHASSDPNADEMVDLKGKPYKKLSVAFLYRSQYVSDCTCKPHPWDEQALAKHRAYAEAAKLKGKSKNQHVAGASKSKDRGSKRNVGTAPEDRRRGRKPAPLEITAQAPVARPITASVTQGSILALSGAPNTRVWRLGSSSPTPAQTRPAGQSRIAAPQSNSNRP